MRRLLTLLLVLLVSVPVLAKSAAELQLALRKLNVVGGALYVAAHPDDENTALLAWFSNERLLRSAYLSVTRGDGGQNLIGTETGASLGLIRTQELLAARRIDGAEQMFTRAVDFGYSKTAAETLAIWGHDEVLADVVWAIRRFQPDVIVTRFPVTGEGGHGHHTSSAILAEEAFAAAGDASKFPEQLRYVRPWSPKRIFFNRFSWRPMDPSDPALAKSLRVDLGTYNPQLGRAYTEMAAQSRTLHKSQGFGAAERRGTILNYFDQRAGDPATTDLLEGIDATWKRYPGGEKMSAILERAAAGFDPDDPPASVPFLLEAFAALQRLRAEPEWSDAQKPWVEGKKRDLLDAIRECAGIAIDVAAADSTVTAGGELPVSVTVVNRSSVPFRLSMVASIYASPSKAPGAKLEKNQPVKTDLVLKIPTTLTPTQPYWLEREGTKGLYNVSHALQIGKPENGPVLPIHVTLEDGAMNTLIFSVPVVFRRTDPVAGEQIREVGIVPPVTVRLGSHVYLFPDTRPRPVTVWMRSYGAKSGTVRLVVPDGWKAEPASRAVTFEGKGDEARAIFQLTPPAKDSTAAIVAEVELEGGAKMRHGIVELEYAHIPPQRILGEAAARVVRADIRRRGDRVGYVMGSGDSVPDILRQVGYDVALLSDDDLDRGDFSRFDAVITGIRAYNTRTRLKLAHAKLMDYVEKGGTVVVQYNTLDDLAVPVPGPYPFKISRDRVTVEEAPVKLLAPDHPLLKTPNRITQADFEGWVQERGLYFTTEWDPRYTTLLSTNDPGEPEKAGGEITARHGKGVFVYTSFAWWRQLPAGVPGAIRAFVNLVSAE